MSKIIKSRFINRIIFYSLILIIIFTTSLVAFDIKKIQENFSETLIEKGIFCMAFFILLFWVLKENAKREDEYLKIIKELKENKNGKN